MQLLVDSNEFWTKLKSDIALAKESVHVQTLSFEGDKVGKNISDELKKSDASDIRIIVDSYTKYIISDKFIYTPANLANSELRREVSETKKMIGDLKQNGVKVQFVNPVGFLLHKFPARNHKKMILIDGHIAYIGGINFSEHNFYWHDMMLRIENDEIAEFLGNDFKHTWQGENINQTRIFDGIELISFDGNNNEKLFRRIMDLLDSAKESICIESPYLSFPFFEKLKTAREKGVDITVITPDQNNKKTVKKYILWECRRSDLRVQLYQGRMTHLKAILIDDTTLIMGSTNFDFLSYTLQQEIAAIITEPKTVNDFKTKILAPDLRNSVEFSGELDKAAGQKLYRQLKSLGRLAVFLNRGGA